MAGATLAWRVLSFAGFNNDHYIYLAGAQQMVLGDGPYATSWIQGGR
jgi:hypothetical protein